MKPNPGRASEPYPAENFTKIRARPGGFVCALQCALPGCCVRESALAAGILEMRRRHQWPESRLQLASQSRDRPGQVRAHSHIHKQFLKNVFFIFSSEYDGLWRGFAGEQRQPRERPRGQRQPREPGQPPDHQRQPRLEFIVELGYCKKVSHWY